MEILSSLTTRTDSGSGVKPRSGSGVEVQSSKFERMFEEELTRQGSKIIEKNADTYNESNDDKAALIIKDEDNDNAEETLAAGVMGNLQNVVVFILEGDSKSAETPEILVENKIVQPETDQIVNPEINETKPEINTAVTNGSPEYAQVANAVNAEAAMIKPEAENIEVNNTNANGEMMARMPEIRTQESQDNADNSSKFSENGNLSPLENENDKTKVTGQKDKTYQDTAEAIKNTAEDKTQPAINEIAPPLSEGIKPEQFKAAQQMTQAALSTPVKPENLFQEMISRVETMQNDTKSAMTIQLNPEFLGKVALEVSVDAAGLHVKINAEDSGVRSMINGQLTTLIESLENKGIAVVEVEVAYTGVNYGTFQDPREGSQQQNKQQHSTHRETNTKDQIAFYTVLPDLMDYYFDTGVSSVEYRA